MGWTQDGGYEGKDEAAGIDSEIRRTKDRKGAAVDSYLRIPEEERGDRRVRVEWQGLIHDWG